MYRSSSQSSDFLASYQPTGLTDLYIHPLTLPLCLEANVVNSEGGNRAGIGRDFRGCLCEFSYALVEVFLR